MDLDAGGREELSRGAGERQHRAIATRDLEIRNVGRAVAGRQGAAHDHIIGDAAAGVFDRLDDAHGIAAIGTRDVLVEGVVAGDRAGNRAGEDVAVAGGLEHRRRVRVAGSVAGISRATFGRAGIADQRHDASLGDEARLQHGLLADRRVGNARAGGAGVGSLRLACQREPVGEGLIGCPHRKLDGNLLAAGVGGAVEGAEIEADGIADRVDSGRRRDTRRIAEHGERVDVGTVARRHRRQIVDRQRQEGLEVEIAVVALREIIGHRVGDEFSRLHLHRVARIDGRVADLGDLHPQIAGADCVDHARSVGLVDSRGARDVAGDLAGARDGVGRRVAFAQARATVDVGITIEHLGIEGDGAFGATRRALQHGVAAGLRAQQAPDIEVDHGLAAGIAREVIPEGSRTVRGHGLAVVGRHAIGDRAEVDVDGCPAVADDAQHGRHARQQGHAVAQDVLELELAQVEIVRDLEFDRVLHDVARREAGRGRVGHDGAFDLNGERLGGEGRFDAVAAAADHLGAGIERAGRRCPVVRGVGVGRVQVDRLGVAGAGVDDLATAECSLRDKDRDIDCLLRRNGGEAHGDRAAGAAGRGRDFHNTATADSDGAARPLHVVRQLHREGEIVDRLAAGGGRGLERDHIVAGMARTRGGLALAWLRAHRGCDVEQLDVLARRRAGAEDRGVGSRVVQRIGAVLIATGGDHLQPAAVGEFATAVESESERDLGLRLARRETAERQGEHVHRVTDLEARRRHHEGRLAAGVEQQRIDGADGADMPRDLVGQHNRLNADIDSEVLRRCERRAIIGDGCRPLSGRDEELDERAVAHAVRGRIVEGEGLRE